jgi:predicted AAA+ superfamily ATPase
VDRLFRKIERTLEGWKNDPYRKPLILQGARQTGKTYSVLGFGKAHYDNVAYANFENGNARAIFANSIEPKDVVPALEAYTRQTVTKGRTLLFLDEIQLCPPALTSLKYFCEFAPEYHVIVAGSLLGVAVNRETYSFPVGKVNFATLCPMDFEEFLLALEHSQPHAKEMAAKIKDCFETDAPMELFWHNRMLELYRAYLVVGGLPECVSKYAETENFQLVRVAQDEILASYLNDMSKYNKENEIKKTRLAYSSVATQLSKKNTRFQYKLIKSGGRAAEFGNAIEWLVLSGIVARIFNLDDIKKPLSNYKNIDDFKIFMSDVGLLCANKEIMPNDVLRGSRELDDFKGGMTENYVCQQLVRNGYTCYYWHSEGKAELDFVIQREGKLIPIEVKSAENRQAKSLTAYMKRFEPAYAIKISAGNFGFENGIKTIPLYAAFCI